MLSGIYHPWEVRFHVKKLAEDRGATFIKGKAIKVDPLQHLLFLDSGQKVLYDVLSFNLKKYIDRKFMRAFQISGELDEQSENVE